MHRRCALPLLVCCAWLAAGVPAASAPDVAVYGLELEVGEERERLLIFADAPLEPQLIEVDEHTLMVALPGSALDPSAPTHISPSAQGTVVRVTAFDRAGTPGPPEVRVVIQRRPGAPPAVERRASVIALDFEARPRAAEPQVGDTVSVAYKGVNLKTVIFDLATALGEPFIFDDTLYALGTVTIEGPPRVSRAEARALIDSLLLLRNMAAIPAPGGGYMVVPINGVPAPWAPRGDLPESDAPVTTMIRLETTNAASLLPAISPYFGNFAIGSVFTPTNSLILSGPASLLRQLRTVIEELDQLDAGRPLIWRLRYASAKTTADQVRAILDERDAPLVTSDDRLNALLLRVRPEALDRTRSLVDHLDRPTPGHGNMHVVPVRHADPEKLVEQLIALRDAAAPADAGDPVSGRAAGLRGLSFEAVVDRPTHSIVLRAAPETVDAIIDVIEQLDRIATSVRVEVTIASLDIDDALTLGMDFLIPTLSNPKSPDDLIAAVASNPSGGGIQTVPSADIPFVASFTRAPLLVTVVDPITGASSTLSIPRESASITMNDRDVRTDMLMHPQLLMTSGDENEIFAGDNVPIPVAQAEPSADVVTLQKNIERQDVGTSLRVTPTAGAQGAVQLELRIEVSTLRPSQAGDVENVGPTIGKIEVESVIRLREGEVAVIAALTGEVQSKTVTGAPWLKDIPILGFVFRTTKDRMMKRYLLIAAQADILRPETSELAETLARELGPPEVVVRGGR